MPLRNFRKFPYCKVKVIEKEAWQDTHTKESPEYPGRFTPGFDTGGHGARGTPFFFIPYDPGDSLLLARALLQDMAYAEKSRFRPLILFT